MKAWRVELNVKWKRICSIAGLPGLEVEEELMHGASSGTRNGREIIPWRVFLNSKWKRNYSMASLPELEMEEKLFHGESS